MSVHHWVQCALKPEEGIESSETKDTDAHKTTLVLGIELGCSGREASALVCWAISLSSSLSFLIGGMHVL